MTSRQAPLNTAPDSTALRSELPQGRNGRRRHGRSGPRGNTPHEVPRYETAPHEAPRYETAPHEAPRPLMARAHIPEIPPRPGEPGWPPPPYGPGAPPGPGIPPAPGIPGFPSAPPPVPGPLPPTRVWLDPDAGWKGALYERLLAKRIVLASGLLDDEAAARISA